MPRIAQKKFNRANSLNFSISMEPLVKAIASGEAMVDLVSVQNPKYLEAVVAKAFENADSAFNMKVESYAKSGGPVDHMYEWGTVGINDSRSNVRRSASDPTARLWHTFRSGVGLTGSISFVFKPSVANVPKPTKQETNMDPAVIAKLKDHVFHWKGKVFELGESVTIKRKHGTKFLLLPNYGGRNNLTLRANDRKRGYTLTKGPHEMRITARKGQFTSYWKNYWSTTGSQIVGRDVYRMILQDFQPEFIPSTLPSGKSRPVGTFQINALTERQKRKVKARVMARAQKRL